MRAREHQVGKSELMYTMQALYLRSLKQVQVDAAQLHAAMNAIMDDLVVWHMRKIKIELYIGFEKHYTGAAAPDRSGLVEAALYLVPIDLDAVRRHHDQVVADGSHIAASIAGDVLQFVGDLLQGLLVVLDRRIVDQYDIAVVDRLAYGCHVLEAVDLCDLDHSVPGERAVLLKVQRTEVDVLVGLNCLNVILSLSQRLLQQRQVASLFI
jgi:hypothetical protein